MNKYLPLTLCIIHQKDRILLGQKKRGFGKGKWNGFGGKVEPNETIEQACIREVQEECSITPGEIEKHGILLFQFQDETPSLEVHVFSSTVFRGTPTESDEMSPRWFAKEKIPFESMWKDDQFWLPQLLEGKKFQGDFLFANSENLLEHSIEFE